MHIHETDVPGVLILKPDLHGDERGFFKETWQRDRYAEFGLPAEFVQDNLSRSVRGTLRGLHFQLNRPQGKLVQAVRGEVFDVAVDVRRDSPTFGRWIGERLSESNHLQMYVPPGFAHGFCVLSESADFAYKCTDFYDPESERSLLWNDPAVGIEWPLDGEPIVSEKDAAGSPLSALDCYGQNPAI